MVSHKLERLSPVSAAPDEHNSVGGSNGLSTPRCPRYFSLDAWRGVACLGVIVYHATLYSSLMRGGRPTWYEGPAQFLGWLASHGSMGVPLFFVISGYCIAAAADNARRRVRPAKSYFWRRFRRIYPPLWAAMIVSVVLHLGIDYWLLPGAFSRGVWLQPRPWWYSSWQWVGNLTLTETWLPYVVGGQRVHFPTQAWTLCYEEQFYALTGLLIAVAPRHFFSGAVVMTLLAGGLLAAARVTNTLVVGWFFDGSWFTFAAGILTYFVLNYRTRRAALGAALGMLFIAPVAFATVGVDSAAGLVFASVLVVIHPLDGAMSNAGFLYPIAWCGTMCYSLYLVHQPLVRGIASVLYDKGITSLEQTLLITVPAALVVSIAAGRAFYEIVERRFVNTLGVGRRISAQSGATAPARII